jgi:hypothetical protein
MRPAVLDDTDRRGRTFPAAGDRQEAMSGERYRYPMAHRGVRCITPPLPRVGSSVAVVGTEDHPHG